MSAASDTSLGRIDVSIDGAIGTLTIDHVRRRNAMTSAMWSALPAAVEQLEQAEQVRVIVLRGRGSEAFVSGADISEFQKTRTADNAREYERINERAFDAVKLCEKPTIALIHGFCIGGGVGLAIGADLRIAADDALFGVPAAKLGLGYPPESLATLLALVGPARVKELFFTAKRFSAREALAMGLVNEVVEKPQLERHVEILAQTIASNAPLTLRSIKLTLAELSRPAEERDHARVEQAVQRCFASEDYQEGVRAFLEKRVAHFRGR